MSAKTKFILGAIGLAGALGATQAHAQSATAAQVESLQKQISALEKKLNAAGVTSLTQIAAWKKADAAKFDEELDLRGRVERDEWVAQAKDLVAGKPPRAKVDQEAVADKAEDKTK